MNVNANFLISLHVISKTLDELNVFGVYMKLETNTMNVTTSLLEVFD